MKKKTELIVMLTHNDKTVKNAFDIFDRCKDSSAEFWGFKEEPLPHDEMKALFSYMKRCGKKTCLEVVAYTEDKCMQGAETAAESGCDILMGTVFSDKINDFCKKYKLKYMPFVGKVSERPSVLGGTEDGIIEEAKRYIKKGVFGFDLLGYRYTGDPVKLNERFVSEISLPVCIAGSVNCYERLDELKRISPWAFTVGGAFFENKFGDSFSDQIENVCRYMNK